MNALLVGGKTVVYSKTLVLDPDQFLGLIKSDGVTILEVVPSYLSVLLGYLEAGSFSKDVFSGLSYLMVTGETLQKSLVERWFSMYPGIRMINAYGPTEASDDITHCVLEGVPEGATISIGSVIPNLRVYIVDEDLQLCPRGVKGEIVVSGIGVGRGYLNQPEKTSLVFIEDPFITEDSVRMYRTGDMGRWLSDGTIEFFGRKDNQVKVHGHRIELGEIESCLSRHELIREVVVLVLDRDGGKDLVCYYVSDQELLVSDLRSYLLESLPDYMVPGYYIQMDVFPLTINGKVDRNSLPSPEISLGDDYVGASTAIEEELVTIWSDVLGIEEEVISVTRSFFELGGDSLKALVLLNKVHKKLNVKISLKDIFNFQTVRDFSNCIDHAKQDLFKSITKLKNKKRYKLSSSQQRLYFIHSFDKESLAYNMPQVARIQGDLDVEKVEDVFNQLIQRHESFRTSFVTVDEIVYQRIIDNVNFKLEFFESSESDVDNIVQNFIRPFDLEKAPLIRVGLIRLEKDLHVLMVDMHHIITDGVSHGVLIKDFIAIYKGLDLPDLRLTYKDYAEWQQSEEYQEDLSDQRDFWLNQFSDEINVLELPTDYIRPKSKSYKGENVPFSLTEEETKKLKAIGYESGATMFMTLLSVFTILLNKLSNQKDIIIGTQVSGRDHADLEEIIGAFLNAIALRNQIKGDLSFIEFLKEVKQSTLLSFDHQSFPYEELIEELKVARDASRNPLFDVMFMVQNFEVDDLILPGLSIKSNHTQHQISKLDLALTAEERNNQIYLNFEYSTDLFDATTIAGFVTYFKEIVSSVISDPNILLSDLHILPEEESSLILDNFVGNSLDYPKDKTIVDLFELCVDSYPDRIAVSYDGLSYTYKDLNARANQLAHYLVSNGVVNGSIVGLLLDRSLDMLVGILGVLKSGAGYLPIDSSLPVGRIEYMLDQSRCTLLLSDAGYLEHFSAYLPVKDIGSELLYQGSSDNLNSSIGVDDLAYCIFTSGSTGVPKGVMMGHKGVVNLVHGLHDRVYSDLGASSLRVGLLASYSFDASVQQIFGALLQGHSLYICKDEDRKDGDRLLEFYNSNKIEVSDGTPTHLRILLSSLDDSSKLLSLRKWMLAGEVLSKDLVNSFYNYHDESSVRLYNIYGPTETCVDSTSYEIHLDDLGRYSTIPIGRPLGNERIYITDSSGILVPVGVEGEICIAGDGLAHGYIGDTELTSTKFTKDWLPNEERVYRTGDLGRWLPDGNIEYLGRKDSQIKLRGYRIELGEIESQLLSHEAIQDSVVVLKEQEEGNASLIAYVVVCCDAHGEVKSSELRSHLVSVLPEYMIPSYYVQIESLPLTRSGKIDRKALPDPEFTVGDDYVAPQSEEEHLLAKVWAKVLGLDKVGITDDFFAIGGDSIRSIQVCSRMKQEGYELSIQQVFNNPTIKKLSLIIKKNSSSSDQSTVTGLVGLTGIQRDFVSRSLSAPGHYNQSVLLQFSEGISASEVRSIFKFLSDHHDALRMRYDFSLSLDSVQYNDDLLEEDAIPLLHYDLLADSTWESKMLDLCTQIQGSIDLSSSPMFRLGLFDVLDGSRLLIVIHHLVIDGVSWRILFDDIEMLYSQLREGLPLSLPMKTDSFQLWSSGLKDYLSSFSYAQCRDYWSSLSGVSRGSLGAIDPEGSNYVGDELRSVFSLSDSLTKSLLGGVHSAFNTQINDILLSGFVLSYLDSYGLGSIGVDMEGHGREEVVSGLDISRTIGWFTSIYPVLLSIEESNKDLGRVIKSVKESLRGVPNNGFDYLLYKYLDRSDESRDSLLDSQISFNYLGQFDSDTGDKVFEIARESVGEEHSSREGRVYEWDISGLVSGGQLHMSLVYSGARYSQDDMDAFMKCYADHLESLISYCMSYEGVSLTPSDLSYNGLGISDLEALESRYDIEDIYGLSPMQEGMLFHWLLDKDSDHYFNQISYQLEGDLDVSLFEKSYGDLVSRYGILRTLFLYEDYEDHLQLVLRDMPVSFEYLDVRGEVLESERSLVVSHYLGLDRSRKFDLGSEGMMRVGVYQMGDDDYEIIWSFHHILMDGWCMSILVNDFNAFYQGYLSGQTIDLPPVVPYSSYINWLSTREVSSDYWVSYLSGYSSLSTISRDRLGLEGFSLSVIDLILDGDKVSSLRRLSESQGVTLNTIIQSAWGILLGRYNNVSDVVFGAVVSGRPSSLLGVESIVGLFINTIPVRIVYSGSTTLGILLKEVQASALESEPHHYDALTEIQSKSGLGSALLDHVIVFENYPIADKLVEQDDIEGGYGVSSVEVFEQTNYDLSIVVEPGEELRISFQYNENRFDSSTIAQLSSHLQLILDQMIRDIDQTVDQISLLREEEQVLLSDFNATSVAYPQDKTIIDLFESRVALDPDQIAVFDGESSISYRALNERVNQQAHFLISKGIKPGEVVGILMDRSIDFVTSVLSVLKIGGLYLPLPVGYPKDRLVYMIEDSGASLVILSSSIGSSHGDIDISCTSYDYESERDTIRGFSSDNLGLSVLGDIYVIYTSGSTGLPKGVRGTHQGLLNRLYWGWSTYPTGVSEVHCLKTNIGFVDHVVELFSPLLSGVSLRVYDEQEVMDVSSLYLSLIKDKITRITLVPTYLKSLLETKQSYLEDSQKLFLKYVFSSGEYLSQKLAQEFYENFEETQLVNLYGSSEVAADVTFYNVNKETISKYSNTVLPIGRPISNTSITILNERKEIVPIGIPGEIYVSGDCLTQGYVNKEELNSKKFIRNPKKDNEVLFQTGDHGRWLPDGNIQYLGRVDDQVKIRGYRIELGEIKNQLERFVGIKEAVVISKKDNEEQKLLAYYTSEEEIENKVLKRYLLSFLPDYMVPNHFISLERIPLLPNGKLNKQALPIPSIDQGDFHGPTNEIEKILVKIYSDVLGIPTETISTKISFFDLGGHSIRAIRVINAIRNTFSVDLSLREIFEMNTVEELSLKIGNEKKEIKKVTVAKTSLKDQYAVSPAQERLFFGYLLNTDDLNRNISNAIELGEDVEVNKLKKALNLLVKRHSALRTYFELSEEGVVQKILPVVNLEIESIQCNDEQHLNKRFEEFIRPFDLSKALLIRVAIVSGLEKNYLFVDIHHIICDGMSVNILISDLKKLYFDEELPEIGLEYIDYAEWYNTNLEKEMYHKQYWDKQVSGEIERLNLPVLKDRETVKENTSSTELLKIEKEIYDLVKEYCSEEKVSSFMFFLSISYLALQEITGNTDIIIGTDALGRSENFERTVGTFVNILPLRLEIKENEEFRVFVSRIKELVFGAYEHQEYPYNEILSLVNSRENSLFDVHFSFLNIIDSEQDTRDLQFKSISLLGKREVEYELQIEILETTDNYTILLHYNNALYDKDTISLFLNTYEDALQIALQQKISKLNTLSSS